MSAENLHYLAGIADELDVAQSIPADAGELIGRPDDFRDAARVWREAAAAVEDSSGDVDGKLGGIDTAWQGADAEAFVAHIRDAGLAGKDLADAMTGLADALEHTAEGVGAQLRRFTDLVAQTAEDVRAAMDASDEDGARERLAELGEPARELLESIADYYTAFTRLCDDMAGGATREPGRWEAGEVFMKTSPTTGEPENTGVSGSSGVPGAAGTAAASASGESEEDRSGAGAAAGAAVGGAAVGAAGVGMGMMPMGMMGGMLGQRGGGGGKERQNSSRLKSNPEELFGSAPEAPPSVFGETAKPQQAQQDQPDSARSKLDLPSTLQPAPPKPSIDEALAPPQTSQNPTTSQNPATLQNPTTSQTPTTSQAPTTSQNSGPTVEAGVLQDSKGSTPEVRTAGVEDAPPPKPRG
ncbi:WXG100 family type VII secretion target [Saccharopolyspora sp. ID03-671]|uniref:WXG100 family type VII secretion target n=1 Tax=Saccharopolyspora sp. ID03-671 TaxID=3073066 RepID=UPI00324B3267